jgi:hypothetical protein
MNNIEQHHSWNLFLETENMICFYVLFTILALYVIRILNMINDEHLYPTVADKIYTPKIVATQNFQI